MFDYQRINPNKSHYIPITPYCFRLKPQFFLVSTGQNRAFSPQEMRPWQGWWRWWDLPSLCGNSFCSCSAMESWWRATWGSVPLEKCRNLGDFESGGFKYMELLFFVIVFQCFSNVLGHTGDDWLRWLYKISLDGLKPPTSSFFFFGNMQCIWSVPLSTSAIGKNVSRPCHKRVCMAMWANSR